MKKLFDIDKIDRQIMSIMLQDAKTPYAEIGQKLFVSGGTVHVRLKKLMDQGIIQGSRLNVDFSKLGFDVIAFLGIYLAKSEMYNGVISELKDIPEVISAHYTTGTYSIFAKLICKDTIQLRDVLSTKIQKIDGIQRTETFISLEESINRPPYILEDEDKV
ncbi:MAG: Lrp/AsnC ligand binding domain-containing protein [Saprospiraceae bacterium]